LGGPELSSIQNIGDLDVFVRLLIAGVLGGFIGLQREAVRKSAGFRTHVLVCIGSALIMIVSLELFLEYNKLANVDPARLAAQVVSGIGFLGAGTIMREGATVRGLTTAASLWVVSGIGLAVGAGLYFAAAIATGLVFLSLVYLTKLERLFLVKSKLLDILMKVEDKPGMISTIGAVLEELSIAIKHIEVKERPRDSQLLLELSCQLPAQIEQARLLKSLVEIDGVFVVTFDD
jgi:putative Mg2+ transporter-C (MgtC) family protein